MLELLIELHGEKRICEIFPEIKKDCIGILIEDLVLRYNCLHLKEASHWIIRYDDNVNILYVMDNEYYTRYTTNEYLNIILPKEDSI